MFFFNSRWVQKSSQLICLWAILKYLPFNVFLFQFYSKPISAVSPTAYKQPLVGTFPANGITFPKLSYVNSYNGYPTASYATSHHNAIAYPSISYPAYHGASGIGASYYHQAAPIQTSVQHHGVFAPAPASPVIYGGGIHKVKKKHQTFPFTHNFNKKLFTVSMD